MDIAARSKNGYIVKLLKREQHERGLGPQGGFLNRLSSSKVGHGLVNIQSSKC